MEPAQGSKATQQEASPTNQGQRRATRQSPRLARKAVTPAESKEGRDSIPPKKLKVEDKASGEKTHLLQDSETSQTQTPIIRTRVPIEGLGTAPQNESDAPALGVDSTPVYLVKWVTHKGKLTPVVTQNKNGPCPLLSVINILFLQGKLKLDEEVLEITESELISILRMALMKTLPKDNDASCPDYVQNVRDAMSLIPEIISGLNVNVKFSGVKHFEYTRECLIFDTLRIPLFHGWLYDPQSEEIVKAIGNQSYNQLVESIIRNKSSENPETVAEALLAETFLEGTASQLTIHGLCELNSTLRSGELGILFRNNHFNVILKHEEILCQLVTDQGYLDEPQVVWETLTTINGDETFLDSSFKCAVANQRPVMDAAEEQQISRDFLVALSLQDEQNKQQDKEFGWDAYGNALGAIGMTSDEELARQIQVEEQRIADSRSPSVGEQSVLEPVQTTSQASPAASTPQEEPPKQKEWKCIVS